MGGRGTGHERPPLFERALTVPSDLTGATRRRARTLVGIATTLALAAVPVAVLVAVALPNPLRNVVVVLSGLLFFLVIRWLVSRSRPVAAAWVFMTYFLLVPVNSLFTDGAPTAIDILFVPVIPLMAALVLPVRHAAIALAVAVVELGFVHVTAPDVVYLGSDLTVFVVILLAISGAAALALTVIIEDAFRDADRSRVEAQRLATELQVANSDLEARVRTRTTELADALQREQRLSAQLAELSVRDSLTGLHNRRHMDETIEQMFRFAQRSGSPFSVAVIDLDDFKRINDRFTHLVGDQVLRHAATVLSSCVRASDELIRMGGEEFALLMPATAGVEAGTVCERMRQALATHDWSTIRPGVQLTASFGIATSGTAAQVSDLMRAADEQLLLAKRRGKNQVLSATADVA